MLKLLDDLADIVREIESALGVHLTDQNFKDGRSEIVHIFLHESCHAALSKCVPWIHDLDDNAHTALDEILARLLEEKTAIALSLTPHSSMEQVRELSHYPVEITVGQYEHLQGECQKRYWPTKDIEGMARYTIDYLNLER